jgi:hypothetical protein
MQIIVNTQAVGLERDSMQQLSKRKIAIVMGPMVFGGTEKALIEMLLCRSILSLWTKNCPFNNPMPWINISHSIAGCFLPLTYPKGFRCRIFALTGNNFAPSGAEFLPIPKPAE